MQVKPVTLSGQRVRLESMQSTHAEQLWDAAEGEEIWRYMPWLPNSLEYVNKFVDVAIKLAESGTAQFFVIFDLASAKAVGSTSFLNIVPEHLRLEIGFTWLRKSAQRTGINTEMKYLMVMHAIEDLGCERVEFKTDARNLQSQTALSRIGAVKEGVLRNHMQYDSGERRDSMYFSIIRSEWPKTKKYLEGLMKSGK